MKIFGYQLLIAILVLGVPHFGNAQVVLRDTLVSWQHHTFALNSDYSMKSYTTNDNDIQQVQFNGKVIENELIRLVLVPEYGGRVLSFVYKPTGLESLYQSACGSPYGIGEGNFYYNWLMVWGGIFPTFPEPEHGKSWLIAWDYTILKNTSDTVTVAMEYTDSTKYSGTPGKFNNGITNLTCRVEVSVYKGSSAWDFDVYLINNKSQSVNYEYWTCTTLTPGSKLGETASPLNSEMVVPIDSYIADWSPNNWIGTYGSLYDFSRINYLSKWSNMGIAYASNLSTNYWGVINHENNAGIFRISENIETPGMKFWTWGKNNVDNNMFDFSNGGADNYIELWAGVSKKFFSDATIPANYEKKWKETYVPTVSMNYALAVNRYGAGNILWDENSQVLGYELNLFNPFDWFNIEMNLIGSENIVLENNAVDINLLGNKQSYNLEPMGISSGNYQVNLIVTDQDHNEVLRATKELEILPVNVYASKDKEYNIATVKGSGYLLTFNSTHDRMVNVYNVAGTLIQQMNSSSNAVDIAIKTPGVYIVEIRNGKNSQRVKVLYY